LRQLARSFVIFTTAESSMNKKLVSLAVAAAIAAPTAAMAEAVLYGKLHVSVDYVDITNAYNEGVETIGYSAIQDFPGEAPSSEFLYYPSGTSEPMPVVNATTEPVDYSYMDANGVMQTVTLQRGQSFTLTDGFTVEMPGSDPSQGQGPIPGVSALIMVDSKGNPIPAGNVADYKGWGVAGKGWRGFTTVNPLTGIGGSVNDRANRIGVKGSEDLGNGLKAVYQVEFGVSLADGSSISQRNSFVGLAGDWGTFLVGRHDTPLKISTGKLDLFSDTMADYNGTVGFHDVRAPRVMAYISPSFSGLSFMAAAHAGTGGNNVNDDSLASAYSLALIYKNGPWYGSAAYEAFDSENYMDSDTSLNDKECLSDSGCDYVSDDFTKWRLGLGILDWNGFTLTGIYEQQDDLPGGQQYDRVGYIDPNGVVTIVDQPGIKNQKLWQIQAGYSFGNNMVKAMYGSVDRDKSKVLAASRETLSLDSFRADIGGDRTTWAVGFDHNFSKRTKAYVLYTAVDDDLEDDIRVQGAKWSGFSVGMVHKF
jgi:predicted porin